MLVPDNLKAGEEPTPLRARYQSNLPEFARHYGIAVVPTRARKPKDKAKVEVGVQVVER